MALIPSSAALPALGYPVTEKLAKNNHSLWKAQVSSALKGAKMVVYVDGTVQAPAKTVATSATDATQVPNPDYEQWEATDQQVLNYLLSSLSRDILVQVDNLLTLLVTHGSPSTTTLRRNPALGLSPRVWRSPRHKRATPPLLSTTPR
jgi:hypothetical protein